MQPQVTRPDAEWLVVGGDLGGTSTRVLVAGPDGTPRGRAVAGGGNPVSHPGTAAAALGQALSAALDGLQPSRVRTAVLGVAGGSALGRPEIGDAFLRACSEAGLTCPVRYATDLEIAFASGTAEPDGTVLIAGTGAVAGALEDRRLVRIVDGHGWLLGDDGSGFWLGREAARAALRVLDGEAGAGRLVVSVLRELGIPQKPTDATGRPDLDARRVQLIDVLNSRPPVRLAELAPLVTAAYSRGDPDAERIVNEAASLLLATVCRVRRSQETTPIVLAGSVAAADSPVGARLRELLPERLNGPVVSAANGVGGATWLALMAADPDAAGAGARQRLSLG